MRLSDRERDVLAQCAYRLALERVDGHLCRYRTFLEGEFFDVLERALDLADEPPVEAEWKAREEVPA